MLRVSIATSSILSNSDLSVSTSSGLVRSVFTEGVGEEILEETLEEKGSATKTNVWDSRRTKSTANSVSIPRLSIVDTRHLEWNVKWGRSKDTEIPLRLRNPSPTRCSTLKNSSVNFLSRSVASSSTSLVLKSKYYAIVETRIGEEKVESVAKPLMVPKNRSATIVLRYEGCKLVGGIGTQIVLSLVPTARSWYDPKALPEVPEVWTVFV